MHLRCHPLLGFLYLGFRSQPSGGVVHPHRPYKIDDLSLGGLLSAWHRAPHWVSAALAVQTGLSLEAYAQQRLWAPIGIQKGHWEAAQDGTTFGAFSLYLTSRDLGASSASCFCRSVCGGATLDRLYLFGGSHSTPNSCQFSWGALWLLFLDFACHPRILCIGTRGAIFVGGARAAIGSGVHGRALYRPQPLG